MNGVCGGVPDVGEDFTWGVPSGVQAVFYRGRGGGGSRTITHAYDHVIFAFLAPPLSIAGGHCPLCHWVYLG